MYARAVHNNGCGEVCRKEKGCALSLRVGPTVKVAALGPPVARHFLDGPVIVWIDPQVWQQQPWDPTVLLLGCSLRAVGASEVIPRYPLTL